MSATDASVFARAVAERRSELGWTQTELARRAGMTQPGVSRIELAGTTPTLSLLTRLAAAMDSELCIHIDPADKDATVVAFTPRARQAAA